MHADDGGGRGHWGWEEWDSAHVEGVGRGVHETEHLRHGGGGKCSIIVITFASWPRESDGTLPEHPTRNHNVPTTTATDMPTTTNTTTTTNITTTKRLPKPRRMLLCGHVRGRDCKQPSSADTKPVEMANEKVRRVTVDVSILVFCYFNVLMFAIIPLFNNN